MALTQISAHFTLEEMYKSDVAIRHGIDNRPPPEIVPKLRLLAEKILEPVRTQFAGPFSLYSVYRCPTLNALVKGSVGSQHILGEAADIGIVGVPNPDLAKWILRDIDFDQLILEFYQPGQPESGWVHCSIRSAGQNRREVITFNGSAYLRTLIA